MRAAALLAACLAATGCASLTQTAAAPAVAEVDTASARTWRRVDAATSRLTDLASMDALAAQFPDSGAVQVRLFNALLTAGEAPRAYALLDRIEARGYRFSPRGEEQINAFFADHGYPKPLALAVRPGDVREASTIAATVPADVHIVESALRERRSGRIYVTSIASRGLFRQDGRGGWERVELPGAGSLAGMLQAPDGTIWTASGAYEPTPDPDSAYRGAIGYDPATGAVRRIDAAPGVTPSDMALGPDGSLFAADPLTGGIYRAYPGEARFQLLVAPGTFRSAQGLAVSADGRFLYVSDYGYGLALVDLRNGRIDRMPAPSAPFVDGTDGIWLSQGRMVTIQNGARPARIVIHTLSADGRAIVDSRVLESAHPGWTEPGAGTVSDGELLYVATGQWDRFAERGESLADKPPLATDLRLLRLAEKPIPPPKKRR